MEPTVHLDHLVITETRVREASAVNLAHLDQSVVREHRPEPQLNSVKDQKVQWAEEDREARPVMSEERARNVSDSSVEVPRVTRVSRVSWAAAVAASVMRAPKENQASKE